MAVFRIEDLSSEMCERLASDNEDLRKKIANLESEASLKDKRREVLESKIEDLEDKIEELRKLIILVSSLTSTIAQQV